MRIAAQTPAGTDREPVCLVSVKAAARQLGIGRTLVYELMGSGQLAFVKIGRRRLIPQAAIDAFIAGLSR